MGIKVLFPATWAFVYSVYGLNYIFSVLLSQSAAQMSAVCVSFLAFSVAGINQPELPQLVALVGGRGWMLPALSPIRWFWAYLHTVQMSGQSDVVKEAADGWMTAKGYSMEALEQCSSNWASADPSIFTLADAWSSAQGWVCKTDHLLFLGLLFRFVAALCLVEKVKISKDTGLTNLVARAFGLLQASFFFLFLIAEVWIFGLIRVSFEEGSWLPVFPPGHNITA